MKEKALRTQAADNDSAATDVLAGIDTFEESLRRIQDQTDGDIPDALLSKTSQETPDQFLATLTAKVCVCVCVCVFSCMFMWPSRAGSACSSIPCTVYYYVLVPGSSVEGRYE